MLPIPADIFTEPEEFSPDGLANLGTAPPSLAVIVNDRGKGGGAGA
jgi:hypothetical protein